MAKPSLFFIGLDAAEPRLLRRWMASGDLPNLTALAAGSLWGDVEGAPGFGDGVLWTSLTTGAAPGRHGRSFNWHLRPGTYQLYRFNEDHHLKARPIWETFSEAGLECAVVDLVRAGLSTRLKGIQLADWLSHDPIFGLRSTPEGLAAQVVAEYGDDPFAPFLINLHRERPEPEAFFAAAMKRIEAKTRYLESLIAAGRFDVVMAAYSEAHDIGHHLWHLHDETHPEFDAGLARKMGDPLKLTYRALDRALGRLFGQLPDDATVMVFGGPGFRPSNSGRHLLPRVLDRLQYGRPQGLNALKEAAKSVYRRVVPRKVQRIIRPHTRPITAPRDKEWGPRLAFMLPHADTVDFIRVNLEGREPAGRVKRQDFDAYRAGLAQDLLALRNPDTGRQAVNRVIDIVARYPGPNAEELPDLAVEWNADHPINAVTSEKTGTIRGRFDPIRTADHNLSNMMFLKGCGVRPRALSETLSYLDVAATIPRLAGIDNAVVDGTPIPLG